MLLNMAPILLVLALSCSGQNNGLRSPHTDHPSDNTKGDDGTAKGGNPSGSGHENIAKASDVIPITGINLTVYVACVKDATNRCNNARLGADIRIDAASPLPFGAETKAAFKIKNPHWEFSGLQKGVTCEQTNIYHPLCFSDVSSLSNSRIKATLTFEWTGGAAMGQSPDAVPLQDGRHVGNFLKISEHKDDVSYGYPELGLMASGVKYDGASAGVTQIWAVLKGNESYLDSLKDISYVTNILYDGGGTPSGTDWDKSMSLCASVNSGDGAGKWSLPTEEELYGPGYASGSSNGGFYAHDLKNVTFAGGDWASHYIWSSSPAGNPTYAAWIANMSNGLSGNSDKFNTSIGAVCVR